MRPHPALCSSKCRLPCSKPSLDAHNHWKTCKPPDGNIVLVQGKLELYSHVRAPGPDDPQKIPWSEIAAMLPDELHLLLKNGSATVACKDQEAAHRALTSLKVFVQITSYR